MATEKKHIAVYLDAAVEQALIAFCEQKNLKSKKGTMFSAGVNAALAEFFGISNSEASNTPQEASNIHRKGSNTLASGSNIPIELSSNIPIIEGNIPAKNLGVRVLLGKSKA